METVPAAHATVRDRLSLRLGAVGIDGRVRHASRCKHRGSASYLRTVAATVGTVGGSHIVSVVRRVNATHEELPVDPLDVLRQRRSRKWSTYPDDVLPLGLAEMDFAIAPEISHELHESVNRSDLGYASPQPGLGEAFSRFASRRWGLDVRPSWVTAVTDVGLGVVELLRLLTRASDTVVTSPPVYPPFFSWPSEAGARRIDVPLAFSSDGYHLDLTALDRAFRARPAVYLLCSPHNPVGRVYRMEELEALVELAVKYDVKIISDEVFGPLTLPGATFTPLLKVRGANEVAVSVLSASKAFNIAGLKCAVIISGSTRIASLLERLPWEVSWRAGHLGVIASMAAFDHCDNWLDRLLITLDGRRTLLDSLIRERIPTVTWHRPEAGYLAWLNCVNFSGNHEAKELFLTHSRVALDRGEAFGTGGNGYVRLNFATSHEILDQATAAMAIARPNLTGGTSRATHLGAGRTSR
jgi:cystathionine beta-lyase